MLGGTYRVMVELATTDEQRLATLLETDIQIPRGEEANPNQPIVVNLLGEIAGLVFPIPSRYWFVLSLDGKELDRLLVAVGTPPPGETAVESS